ncbi:MAG TPA: EAL domain-containing protein [Geobacteraceae bacterium]|nr:EAL domain-containing protein [Geobacteraceae bacterium]
MKASRKTKRELLEEIVELRRRIAEMEELSEKNAGGSQGKVSAEPCIDILTGLPDRSAFYNYVKHAVAQAGRRRQILSVLFFSLDRFKLINDSLGELVGNLLLKEVAERLKYCMRKSDVLARPGWDEFMILLPEIARVEDATVVVERIFDALQSPFQLNGKEFFINASIGISLYPHDGVDPTSLINNASTAMKRAKEERKNDFRFYSPNINSRAFKSLLMENNLRTAIKREEVYLHYQPQIDIASGRIIGQEALLRWTHPEMGPVPPEEFIPLMEEIGLASSLSEWVLQNACDHNSECQKKGISPMRVAVNLSSRQLHQNDLVPTISRVLKETGLEPELLELEITESDIVRNIESTSKTLNLLNKMGVQIAIDDFGKGYSSLSYLRYFPLNKLKIDKIFVDAISTDYNNAAISTAIVTLAHSLKLSVIAEGVEKVEQLEYLRGLQCDAVQGFLFSRPVPADESLQLLTDKKQFDLDKSAESYNCADFDRFWLNRREFATDIFPDAAHK